MLRFGSLNVKGRLLLAIAVGGALFGVATAVQASIPDSAGVIHGCYYQPGKIGGTGLRPGDLRVIDPAKGQSCATDERPLDWGQTPVYSTSGSVQTGAHVVTGSVTTNSPFGQATVTLSGAAAFTSTTSYECTGTPNTSNSGVTVSIHPTANNSFTVHTNFVSQQVGFICIGN